MYEDRNEIWESIDYDTWLRLAECRSIRSDVPVLARSVYKCRSAENSKYTPEDALVYVFEHLDSNNQYYLTDVGEEQFNEWVNEISQNS